MTELNSHFIVAPAHVRGVKPLRRWLKCCAVLIGFWMPTGVLAAEPTTEVVGQVDSFENGDSGAESVPLNYYLLLGSSLALGLGIFGFYWVLRRRRERRYFSFEDVHYDDELLMDRLNGENTLGATRSIIRQREPQSAGPGGVFDDNTGSHRSDSNKITIEELTRSHAHFYASQDLESPAEKSFSPRRKLRQSVGDQALFDEQYGLERLVCSGCDRRYGMGAQYCYHDGLPLMQDTRQLAQISTRFKLCKKCGWESDLGTEHPESCSNFHDNLFEIDAADLSTVLPMLPMMVCPSCGNLGAPGQTHCAADAQLLRPLLDIRSPELPLHGFGPRRKVCTECGAAHGPSTHFCTQDGSALVVLN